MVDTPHTMLAMRGAERGAESNQLGETTAMPSTPENSPVIEKVPTYRMQTPVKREDKPSARHQQTTVVKMMDNNEVEFELYATAVEKGIHSERALTEMRLIYINQLRPSTDETCTRTIDMTDLVLLRAEDTADSDSSIMLSAIQDGNLALIRQFIKELNSTRRKQLLKSKVNAKYGMSFLQVALELDNYEIFRELRINMDRETKRSVAELQDESGNNLLHSACSTNTLLYVQNVLANYTKNERPHLIMTTNNKRDNCLKMAATNPHTEVFLFLLKQFLHDGLLWQCIRTINNIGITVGHSIVSQSTSGSCEMLTALILIAKRLNRVDEFLFQDGCTTTLLHSVVTASMLDYEEEGNALTNLTLLLTTASNAGSKDKLLWKKQEEDLRYTTCPTALYRLASVNDQYQTRLCEYILRQVSLQQRVDYIMTTEVSTGQNALHAAAKSDNVPILECLLRHIPSSTQMKCLMGGSKAGSTPLHIAAADGVSVRSFKAILDHLSQEERKRLVLSKESHGNTPILIAFIEGNIALVNMLMKEAWVPRGMIFSLMSARNNAGWTIIHLACIRLVGDTLTDSVLRFLSDFPGVNLRALINHVDFNGNTVLHLAALLFRPTVVMSVMKYLQKSEHRKLLTKKNNDGLVASQLCNMHDLAVLKYLQPLQVIGWSDVALIAKRDSGIYKIDTQRRLKHFEEEYQINPTPIDTDGQNDTDLDGWEFEDM